MNINIILLALFLQQQDSKTYSCPWTDVPRSPVLLQWDWNPQRPHSLMLMLMYLCCTPVPVCHPQNFTMISLGRRQWMEPCSWAARHLRWSLFIIPCRYKQGREKQVSADTWQTQNIFSLSWRASQIHADQASARKGWATGSLETSVRVTGVRVYSRIICLEDEWDNASPWHTPSHGPAIHS